MDPGVICLCALPPALGAIAIAIAHLRQRSWWRMAVWVLIPLALLAAALAGINAQPAGALLCLSGAALLVTVGLVIELRSRRRSGAVDIPETPTT